MICPSKFWGLLQKSDRITSTVANKYLLLTLLCKYEIKFHEFDGVGGEMNIPKYLRLEYFIKYNAQSKVT